MDNGHHPHYHALSKHVHLSGTSGFQEDPLKCPPQPPSSEPGLHKLWYPGIQDRSTWSKFGAYGEHGDVFLFSNLGAL